jgi:hypothetical protein
LANWRKGCPVNRIETPLFFRIGLTEPTVQTMVPQRYQVRY